ncbi:MAG: hypothetical protein MR294_10505 [Bacteroidales bacterium]|nr:hypothetical protein [Bacteroidales bacterium]
MTRYASYLRQRIYREKVTKGPESTLRRRVVMGYNALGRKAINVVLAAACGGGS